MATPYTPASVSQFYNNTQKKNNFEEIEIDVTNIKYSLSLKFKYSPQELFNHYMQIKANKTFNTRPNFNLDFPEIIAETRKEIDPKNFGLKGRDRSNTAITFESYNTYGKQNTNEKRYSFNNNRDEFKHHQREVIIPKNNPLANIAKNHNKFDNPGFKINPVTLSFNSISLKDDQNK